MNKTIAFRLPVYSTQLPPTLGNQKNTFLEKIDFSYSIDHYSANTAKLLLKIAKFKYGDTSTMQYFYDHYLRIIKQQYDWKNSTIIVPVTKSPLLRPIVEMGNIFSSCHYLPLIEENSIKKNKSNTNRKHFSLLNNQDRINRKLGTINITHPLNTDKAIILDDTTLSGITFLEYARALKAINKNISCNAYAFLKFSEKEYYLEEVSNLLPIWEMNVVVNVLNATNILTTTSSRKLATISNNIFKYLAARLEKDVVENMLFFWGHFFTRGQYLSKKEILLNPRSLPTPKLVHFNPKSNQPLKPGQFLLLKKDTNIEELKNHYVFSSSDFVIQETEDGFKVYRYVPSVKHNDCWIMEHTTFTSTEDLFATTLLWE